MLYFDDLFDLVFNCFDDQTLAVLKLYFIETYWEDGRWVGAGRLPLAFLLGLGTFPVAACASPAGAENVDRTHRLVGCS